MIDHLYIKATIMDRAITLAEQAARAGEVPVAALITDQDGMIICEAENRMLRDGRATAHAELLVINKAMTHLGISRLTHYDLWVTLEPCAMCAGAIAHARLRRLYFGAFDRKGGAIEHGPCLFNQPTINHRPEIIGGLQERQCSALLEQFFAAKR